MLRGLAGRTAVVTGAGGGIGQAICRRSMLGLARSLAVEVAATRSGSTPCALDWWTPG